MNPLLTFLKHSINRRVVAMVSASDGCSADMARALTQSPLATDSTSGRVLDVTPSALRSPSASGSEVAHQRLRAKLQRESEFVSVRGTPTHVIKYGSFNDQTRTLVLIIPGNPGVPEYYDHFMETIHLASAQTLPIWCVSHAGHLLPDDANLPQFQQTDPYRSLSGQIDHKLAFIKVDSRISG
jgi:hypothetical protein